VIDIAVVTPSFSAGKMHKGSIWVRRSKDRIRRRCLECLTANGVKLELEAFFERFNGKSFRLQVIMPTGSDRTVAQAIVGLVAAPILNAPHSYKQFQGALKTSGAGWRGTPFDYGYEGQAHRRFQAPWSVPVEPMILLKSLGGDFYTYPSTDADENETDSEKSNG
jgi:hypothetical protein